MLGVTLWNGWNIRVLALLVMLPAVQVIAADDDDMTSTNRERRPIEELFKTDVVFPQQKGELEVEVAGAYQNHVEGGKVESLAIPLSLEYGLTDEWQIEAEWNAFVQHYVGGHSITDGVGDLELGTQYSFLNIDDSLFHIAPKFSVNIPLGSVNKDISDGFVEYEPAIIIARDLPKLHKTEVFTEIGASLVQRVKRPADADDAEPPANALEFGAGFFTLFAHGAATMEFNLENSKWNHHGTENEMYLTPGYLFRVAPNMEIGLGIPVGLNHTSDRYDVMAHIIYEF